MDSLTQPLALVVGGSGAIGSAVIERLSKRGLSLVATYRDHERPARNGSVTWIRFDADEPTTADRVAEVVRADGRPLRTVIHAVGVGSTKRLVADTPLEEFGELWQANALSLVALWRAVAPLARENGASVVALSSETTQTAGAGNGAYTASKAALEAIALTLAKEEAVYGACVNVVAPSLVASSMAETMLAYKGVTNPAAYYAALPSGRALTVDEVAELVVEVAVAEHWRYASGQIIRLSANIGSR